MKKCQLWINDPAFESEKFNGLIDIDGNTIRIFAFLDDLYPQKINVLKRIGDPGWFDLCIEASDGSKYSCFKCYPITNMMDISIADSQGNFILLRTFHNISHPGHIGEISCNVWLEDRLVASQDEPILPEVEINLDNMGTWLDTKGPGSIVFSLDNDSYFTIGNVTNTDYRGQRSLGPTTVSIKRTAAVGFSFREAIRLAGFFKSLFTVLVQEKIIIQSIRFLELREESYGREIVKVLDAFEIHFNGQKTDGNKRLTSEPCLNHLVSFQRFVSLSTNSGANTEGNLTKLKSTYESNTIPFYKYCRYGFEQKTTILIDERIAAYVEIFDAITKEKVTINPQVLPAITTDIKQRVKTEFSDIQQSQPLLFDSIMNAINKTNQPSLKNRIKSYIEENEAYFITPEHGKEYVIDLCSRCLAIRASSYHGDFYDNNGGDNYKMLSTLESFIKGIVDHLIVTHILGLQMKKNSGYNSQKTRN